MADVTNATPAELSEQQAPDLASQLAAAQAKNAELDSNYRALQRNQDQRDKSASADVAKLTAEMMRQSELISALVDNTDLLDDDAKEDLRYRQSAAQTANAEAQANSQLLEAVKANLREAGVVDGDDNYDEINELWVDGDYKEALRASRKLARVSKRAVVTPEVSEEDRIAAEVDRRLRAAGVRSVDTNSTESLSTTGVFTKENLGARLASMSPAERKAAHAQIISDMTN